MRWILASLLVVGACSGDDGGQAGDDTGSADPCDVCGPNEVCVQSYDGVCTGGVAECHPKTVDCPITGSCSQECQDAYCPGSPYQCLDRVGCGGESPRAFTCYGP